MRPSDVMRPGELFVLTQQMWFRQHSNVKPDGTLELNGKGNVYGEGDVLLVVYVYRDIVKRDVWVVFLESYTNELIAGLFFAENFPLTYMERVKKQRHSTGDTSRKC